MEGNKEFPESWEAKEEKRGISTRMMCIIIALVALVSLCLGSIGTLFLVNNVGYNPLGLSPKAWEKLKWGVESVDEIYYGEVDDNKLVDGMLMGLTVGLDDYSYYMPKDEAADFMQSVSAEDYVGVGLYIQKDVETNYVLVISPLSDSPAERAGIKTGDLITAVDGSSIMGKDIDTVADSMMGEAGTKVSLTVIKKETGETVVIDIIREKIRLETVASKMIDDEIGYIEVTQFGMNTYTEFVEDYNELCDLGMDKVIVDLRNNAGGYFEQAVNMADIFIEKGEMIVYTKNKNGKTDEYRGQTDAVEIEMVILMNEGTASASEVFIGALRDHNKAILVGTKTFGKGVTQAVVTYEDGGVFKITDTKYYTPSGVCIHGKGIEPEIIVENTENEDLQLEKAIDVLK